MKLDVSVNEVTLSNVGATGEFRIKNSAKAFKILSDGLYSNKIRAIIRELSCNALDSHIAAGKVDVPYEVHLPTLLEPWFAVRDFGTGLDGNQVVNIYTTYFESTKTSSNDFIGALGLGSKSPFSYTENFTVTAIKDKVKRIYSAFINDMGIPCVAEMQTEPTEDIDGVEVKFSVVDRYDYQSFKHEAQQVFKWFKHKPKITGVSDFNHLIINYKEKDIVPGVHVLPDNQRGSTAVMGNIAYPLDKISQPEKHFGSLASLLNCGLILEFPIGALDFAASREELSYVPMTINSIKAKLEELNAELAKFVAKKADDHKCEWARAEYLYSEFRSPLFKSAVVKYVNDTKFELFNPNDYNGKKTFSHKVEDLKIKGLEIRSARIHGNTCSKNAVQREFDRTKQIYEEYINIPVESDVVFVLNDLKTGCYARAKYHFIRSKPNNKYTVQVYCLSVDDKDLTARQKIYDEFLKDLHNPPLVFKASELEKEVRATSQNVGTQGILYLKKKEVYRGVEYRWNVIPTEPDKKAINYYVALDNYTPIHKDGVSTLDIVDLKTKMDQCGIKALADIFVHGVRKNRIKDIVNLKNWVRIEDKIAQEMAKITQSQIEQVVALETVDNYNTRVYTNWDAARLAGPDSTYTKYLEKYAKLKRDHNVKVSMLVDLCASYGRTIVVDTIKKQIAGERTALYAKYPLLQHLANMAQFTGADLAHYIMLVDKQEKNNE